MPIFFNEGSHEVNLKGKQERKNKIIEQVLLEERTRSDTC